MKAKLFLVTVSGWSDDGHPMTLARHGAFDRIKAESLASDLANEMHRQMGGFYNKKVPSVRVEEA